MNPLLAATGVLVCYTAGLAGWVMLRRPSAIATRADPDADTGPTPLLPRVVAALSDRFGDRAFRLIGATQRDTLRTRLMNSGSSQTVRAVAGLKAAYAILGAFVGVLLLLVTANPVFIPLLAFLGWIGPDIRLARTAKARQKRIERDLPDFLDILAVIVAAGSGFRAGLQRVTDALEGPVPEEMTTTLREMDLGASRRNAFERLRERNSCESLDAFVTAVLQAEELGTPLGDIITGIALDLRREFHQTARRQAAKAAPRVGLIVTTIIVPGAIVLIVTALFIGADIGGSGIFDG